MIRRLCLPLVLLLAFPLRGAAEALRFDDVAPRLGLAEIAWTGRLRDAKIIATVGGGAAWGDFDGDGDLDLAATRGIRRPDDPDHSENCTRLLRNDGARFVDVTAAAGLRSCGWGMGVLWEDLDADGVLDLVVTRLGAVEWWRGSGGGTLLAAGGDGLEAPAWNTGAAAFDGDGDGDLDLFVAGYLATTSEAERERAPFELIPIEAYPPERDRLFENLGDGRFREVPLPDLPSGRALAVVAADLDRDGRADLYVANDRDRNTLLRGLGAMRFEDVTDLAGVGYGDAGQAESGMGIGIGDVDGNGWLDLVVTNFAGESVDLYANLGELVFENRAAASGLRAPTWDHLSWGTGLPDFDLDGTADLWIANGHLMPSWVGRIARLAGVADETVTRNFAGPYRQPWLLFRGRGDGGFEPVPTERWGEGVWRGGDAADVDGDGLVDLFLYSSDRRTPSRLLRNRGPRAGSWVEIVLRRPGASPPRAGRELVVTAASPVESARRWHLQATSGASYLSGSAAPLHVGLGDADAVTIDLSGPAPRRWRDLPVEAAYVLPAH